MIIFFQKTEDLWHPKPELITKLGRVNEIGSSILYTSQDPRTALFESSLSPGQHVVVSEIILKENEKLNLQHIGLFEELPNPRIQNFRQERDKNLISQGFNQNGIHNIHLIHRLLAEEFMRNVIAGNENEYSVSVAISKFLLSYEECDGLIYPSKKSRNDYNIAIKPSSADKKLKIKKCYGLQIGDSNNETISFLHIKSAEDIDSAGNITWNSSNRSPLNWPSAKTIRPH